MGLIETLKNTLKDGKLTPASMALIQAGAKMMEAGGPSYQPRNFGTAVGSGLGGLLEGYTAGSEIERRNQSALQDQQYKAAKLDALQNPVPKSGTPGQGFIPPDAKYEKNTEYGIEGWRLKDGSFVPNQKAITEYQMRMTSPENRGLVANAVGGQKPVKALDAENREFYTNPAALNPQAFPNAIGAPSAPPMQQQRQLGQPGQPVVNKTVNIRPSMMAHLLDVWGNKENAVAEIKSNPNAYADKEWMGNEGMGTGAPVKSMSFGEKESVKTNEAIRQKKAENDLLLNRAQEAPLPPAPFKMVQEYKGDITTAASIKADLGTFIDQIDNGTLKLGPFDNVRNQSLLMLNSDDPSALAFGNFKDTLAKIRNDTLRLNKGTQTEGDATRALDEIAGNLTNTKYVKQRLETIQRLNERAVKEKTGLIKDTYSNYGKEAPNLDLYSNQQSTLESNIPKISNEDEYNALPSGTTFIDPDGKQRRKP